MLNDYYYLLLLFFIGNFLNPVLTKCYLCSETTHLCGCCRLSKIPYWDLFFNFSIALLLSLRPWYRCAFWLVQSRKVKSAKLDQVSRDDCLDSLSLLYSSKCLYWIYVLKTRTCFYCFSWVVVWILLLARWLRLAIFVRVGSLSASAIMGKVILACLTLYACFSSIHEPRC